MVCKIMRDHTRPRETTRKPHETMQNNAKPRETMGEAVRNTNLHWNAVMEGVIRISHLIELVYSQKIPKKLVKKILWYYLVTIPNYV